MGGFYKKIIIVNKTENYNGIDVKGCVVLIKESVNVTLSADFIFKGEYNYQNYLFVLSGENGVFYKDMPNACKFKFKLDENFNFEKGASFSVYDKLLNKVISYGEYDSPILKLQDVTDYVKFSAKNEKGVETVYDDEVIATENYYNYKEYELLPNQAYELKSQSEDEKVKRQEKGEPFFYEEGVSYCKNERFNQEKQIKLAELLRAHPKCEKLNRLLLGGEFVKINYDENQSYYVGKIEEENRLKYVCYAVEGRFGVKEKEFEKKARFIPESPFELNGKGYYVIFENAETGEIE